jgi:dUTP pyrophosphatase
MQLSVKKLHPEAKLPTRAHASDAGLDLYSVEDMVLAPGQRHGVATGVAFAIPNGYVGLVWDKSGVALNGGVTCLGGVVDAQYRGEVKVIVLNTSDTPYEIKSGQKIAQLLIQEVALPEVVEVENLDDTSRGDGGFGSTGLG